MFSLLKRWEFSSQIKRKWIFPIRYLTHCVPPLYLSWNWKKEGFPPLYSPKGLEIAYFQKQQYHIDELNKFIKGTVYEDIGDVESIAHQSANRASHSYIYNHSSQAFNNHFFFLGLKGKIKEHTEPPKHFLEYLNSSFGDFHTFKENFIYIALSIFGSGWVWLVEDLVQQQLKIFPTFNAGQPYHERRSIAMGLSVGQPVLNDVIKHDIQVETLLVPLLVVNCWEYAWIHDYGVFGKEKYLRCWFDCIDWELVAKRHADIWKTNEMDDSPLNNV
ncbi:hypothetical protein PNEG_01094 [Pneumocystis murina B123]|uniref:Manganese/iron superoxide dismutase C-terminal domain-containing protein n=1 Tax=Pneumocystis murina (strain B123) TaxID=1069680 RepID=M7PKG7_PNEMU|nr:hypothetical protein PNEG_01094 [Pneumocystis murina B123]EMR10949.1 hypothetical protein PNEG_01094 [Pneumocystis murina B123]